jgi:NADH-quinone oxidoreductase subunit N
MTLLCAIVLLLLLDLFIVLSNKKILFYLSIVGIVVAQWLLFIDAASHSEKNVFLFNDFIQKNNLSFYVQSLVNLSGIITLVFMAISTKAKRLLTVEFYSIFLSILLGLYFLISSNNFFMLVISLELISIGSYILTVLSFDKQGTEAGIKYFMVGAFCTGLMLFGISLLYGFTGSFDFPVGAWGDTLPKESMVLITFSVLLTFTGLFFKISAFPFHSWTPDVYQGAPIPVVAFFSVAPKVVGLATLFKIIQTVLFNN